MKKYLYWLVPSISLIAFIIWTILVKTVDVQYIDKIGFVGFYNFNMQFNEWVKTLNNDLYTKLSNIILIISILTLVAFATVGLVEWIKRKSLKKVDPLLYILLGVYVISLIFYGIFELAKINYSPISIPEDLKASYPSTHVYISVVFVIAGACTLFKYFNFSKLVKWLIIAAVALFSVLAICIRTFSGFHYFTDIIGAVLLSITIVSTHICFLKWYEPKGLIYKE